MEIQNRRGGAVEIGPLPEPEVLTLFLWIVNTLYLLIMCAC
jgi:hypothetical protein